MIAELQTGQCFDQVRSLSTNALPIPEDGWDSVKFVRREYSKTKVDKAGEILASRGLWVAERMRVLPIINNWRSCHAYPLQCYYVTLNKRAQSIDQHAAVAQRMKRLVSITSKLERNRPTPDNPDREKMKLTQMQDIGGCRAILSTVKTARELVAHYMTNRYTEDPYRIRDYVANPKPDGYRCIHLVYRYHSMSRSTTRSELLKGYEGLRIEIQIRSRLQHLWATAVEIVDIFTGQEIKTGKGKDDWKRFLLLMANDIAARERCPLIDDAPTNLRELREELRHYIDSLNVYSVMEGWTASVNYINPKDLKIAESVVLELNPNTRELTMYFYDRENLKAADKQAYELERQHEDDDVQVVRISTDSIRSLKSAYPNFYLNSSSFLAAVRRAVS